MVTKRAFFRIILIASAVGLLVVSPSAGAADRPNIHVIWDGDVGMWNISAYYRGMLGSAMPNIDRIAKEGTILMDHYAQASCTAGRGATRGAVVGRAVGGEGAGKTDAAVGAATGAARRIPGRF